VTSEVIAPAWIQITRQEDGVRLDGRIADPRTAEQLRQAATGAFGAVDNQLTINAATQQPTWLPKLSPLLVELSDWRSGVLDARESGITINGIVDSVSQAERIPMILSDATRLNLIYDLDVVANRVPQLTIVAADGQLTLRGEVPYESILDTIISATAAYTDVDNGLRVGPVADAAWFVLVDDALIRLADWPAWTMSVIGGDGTFTGRAPSSRSLQTQQNDLIDRMGITWETVDLEVSQAALADELTATVSGTLNFATASATLDPESLDLLEGISSVLRANPSAVLIVEGHTDNEGRDDSNLALSQARAEAVVTYLGSLGIDETRLTAIGYGDTRPIAENGTLVGRAQNRRIEFVVEEQGA
jgi:OOP family OmpA-OmpF porin